MKTHITELLGAGADAMTNMYEVAFTMPTGTALSVDATQTAKLRIRADAFNPPADSQQTYEVHWKTVALTRPATKIIMDRVFTITFRVDANYDLYRTLLKWKGLTSAGSVGYASQEMNTLGSVTVSALASTISNPKMVAGKTSDAPDIKGAASASGGKVILWKYNDVWIETITNPEFSTESAEPAKVTATFRFGSFEDEASAFATSLL